MYQNMSKSEFGIVLKYSDVFAGCILLIFIGKVKTSISKVPLKPGYFHGAHDNRKETTCVCNAGCKSHNWFCYFDLLLLFLVSLWFVYVPAGLPALTIFGNAPAIESSEAEFMDPRLIVSL